MRQAPGARLPVQVQMNYNAAHFRKEVLVRLTLRASYYEKILRSAFPPPPDAFSPKPSLAPSRIPAFALTSPWAGRQATLHDFAPADFAGAHLLLCAFNLLPVPPLDGAHALCLAVSSLFGPIAGDRTAVLAGAIVSLALLGAALYFSVCRRGGALFLFASLALFIRAVSQLRLAKRVIKV